jgi:hypothetical protein
MRNEGKPDERYLRAKKCVEQEDEVAKWHLKKY